MEVNPAAGGETSVRACFWFTQSQAIPKPGFVSQLKTPTAAEATSLQDGSVVEEVFERTFPTGKTEAAIKAELAALYVARKAYRDAQPNVNAFYGKFWDGTTWT